MSDDLIVTIQHVRDSGLCVPGARAWFARHGLDFRDFMRNGIRASDALATGDGFAARVVARAREARREPR